MPKSIFDLVTSTELAAYWTTLAPGEPPYLGEELWDTQQKLGLNISWIKGASGLPAVLKPSAFDAAAIPRPRIGFDKLSASMPYFKESMYIDEELRQELNLILQTGNQNYIDSVMNRVFNDEVRLIRSARITRERMRMMVLTTGVISISANGQNYAYDYGVTHKGDAATKWSSTSTADPVSDIRKAIETVYTETGIKPKRGLCNGVTWQRLRNNEKSRRQSMFLQMVSARFLTLSFVLILPMNLMVSRLLFMITDMLMRLVLLQSLFLMMCLQSSPKESLEHSGSVQLLNSQILWQVMLLMFLLLMLAWLLQQAKR